MGYKDTNATDVDKNGSQALVIDVNICCLELQ